MKIKCLPVSVYRTDQYDDCTNGGISSRFRELMVYCPDGFCEFDAEAMIPMNFCMVERRRVYGSEIYSCIYPATVDEAGNVVKRGGYWWMNGGNIANTCDSRFHELSGVHYPLAIHDRREQ